MSEVSAEVQMERRVASAMGLVDPSKVAPKPAPQAAPEEAPAQVAEPIAAPAETAEPTQEAPEHSDQTDNLIEIDFKGGKYKLPTELKDLHEGYLRQEDYTRKTQEVAERQRVIELAEQQAQSQRALQQVTAPYLEQIMSLNNQLSHYVRVDWAAYSDQDPQQANKHWIAYQSLKERKQSLEQEMQGVATQHLQKLKDSAENLRKENSKILTDKVKGWSAERDTKVRDFAVKHYGFSQQEVGQVFDARILRLMNDAHEWQTFQAAKPAITKQAAPAQKTLKPSATQNQTKESVVQAELKKEIRAAKTPEAKARGIQKLLERRL